MITGFMFLAPVTLTKGQEGAIRQALAEHLSEEQYNHLFAYIEKLLTQLPAYNAEPSASPGELKKELSRLAEQLYRAQKTLAYLEKVEKGEGALIDREFMANTQSCTLIERSIQATREPPFTATSGTAWMLDEIRKAVDARIESVAPEKGEQSDHYDLIIFDLACYFKAKVPSIRPSASEGPFFRLITYLFNDVLEVKTKRRGGKIVENPKRRIQRALKRKCPEQKAPH